MRQAQQNRRNNNRGRSRRNQNPLARNFDSNGPDVRIRGNAAHIAEKYASLARDAHASGNPVTAENYQQHAEHYSRIVTAAKAAREDVATARPDPQGKPRRIPDKGYPPKSRNIDDAPAAAQNGRALERDDNPVNGLDESAAKAVEPPAKKVARAEKPKKRSVKDDKDGKRAADPKKKPTDEVAV